MWQYENIKGYKHGYILTYFEENNLVFFFFITFPLLLECH